MATGAQQAERTFLVIGLLEGRNLAAKDSNGKSDPYVIVTNDKDKSKTHHSKVISESLNPIWKESFMFEITHIPDATLRFEVRDKDMIGSDFIGITTIPLADILRDEIVWYDLHDGTKKSGEIRLKLEKAFSEDEAKTLLTTASDGNMIKPTGIEEEDTPETKAMIAEAEHINKESKDTALRALQKIKETEELGIATNDKLKKQGEQIKRIADESDKIESNLNLAERELKTIGSLFGQIENAIFHHVPKVHNTNAEFDAELEKEKQKKLHHDAQKAHDTHHDTHHTGDAPSNTPKEISILSKSAQADYEETEGAINEIFKVSKNLKNIAENMGEEIDEQNKRLDKVSDKIEENVLRIRADKNKAQNMT